MTNKDSVESMTARLPSDVFSVDGVDAADRIDFIVPGADAHRV
jgi:hypothetical protein